MVKDCQMRNSEGDQWNRKGLNRQIGLHFLYDKSERENIINKELQKYFKTKWDLIINLKSMKEEWFPLFNEKGETIGKSYP